MKNTHKSNFFLLGPVGMVRPGPYYVIIYTYIRSNYCLNISPKPPYLDLIQLDLFFLDLSEKF
jgi:hypothetical protein